MKGCGGTYVLLSAVFSSSHKVLWHSGINQVAGMTGGWGNLSLIRLYGDAPCPHPQLLQQHLFTSSGLPVWKAVLSLSVSQTHTWRTRVQHYTWKNLTTAHGTVSTAVYALSVPNPRWFPALIRQQLQMHICLLLESFDSFGYTRER